MIKIKIEEQGKPQINTANGISIIYEDGKVILAEIDMVSKWCEVESTFTTSDGKIGFTVQSTNRSLNLLEEYNLDTTDAVIVFSDKTTGYDIYLIQCIRYTIRIVLIKK